LLYRIVVFSPILIDIYPPSSILPYFLLLFICICSLIYHCFHSSFIFYFHFSSINQFVICIYSRYTFFFLSIYTSLLYLLSFFFHNSSSILFLSYFPMTNVWCTALREFTFLDKSSNSSKIKIREKIHEKNLCIFILLNEFPFSLRDFITERFLFLAMEC